MTGTPARKSHTEVTAATQVHVLSPVDVEETERADAERTESEGIGADQAEAEGENPG